MKTHLHTLDNGLRVILIDTKAFPSLTTLLLVGAGSRYENQDNNGVAHFFEHMAFKGSKKYPDSLTISSVIEGTGGVFNAFTSKDHTGYWIKSMVGNFVTVIDVLSDMVLHPLLLTEEIAREKGVIVEEINMYEDTPQRKVGELYESLLYDGHPLGFDIAGEKKTVKTFTRKTFTDYIHDLYRPKNAVLVVAGGLDWKNNYLEIIKDRFSHWQDGQKGQFEAIKDDQKEPQLLVKYKKTEQAHFCLGFRAFSFFDKRKHALAVFSAILGGGMSSRLFIEVRERRGLCYYISTGRELYYDVGNLVTQAGVTVQVGKVKQAIEIILKEHLKIAKGKIKKDELSRAKELIKGRLILSLEDSFSVASFYGTRMILEEKLRDPEQVIATIDKVSIDDIVSVASDVVKNSGLNLAVIGPFETKEPFQDILTV